jgi:hypothetical protein
MKTYEFNTGTFKQGDDFASFLDDNDGDNHSALMAMAEMYRQAANHCVTLAGAVNGQAVDITGDGQSIMVEGDEEVLDNLCERGYLEEVSHDDDDDEYEEDYDDEDFSEYEEDCLDEGAFLDD